MRRSLVAAVVVAVTEVAAAVDAEAAWAAEEASAVAAFKEVSRAVASTVEEFRRGEFHRRAFVGFGLGSYGYYDGYYPYAYNDDYYDDGGCYLVRRRVHTRYGWRVRPVQICG